MSGCHPAILLALTLTASAQEPAVRFRGDAAPHRATFRTASNLVLINASVLDRDGRFVPLEAGRFHVTDEKKPVAIRQFAVEEAPVSTVIVLDTSGSMRHGINHVREGLRRYLEASVPGDDFCLLSFAGSVPGRCAFTSDPDQVMREASGPPPRGGTALVDAISLALDEVKRGANARRVVLALTDGVDTQSRYRWPELKERAKETTASIYAVTPPPWGDYDQYSAAELRGVAELTGGALFEISKPREYPDFFGKLDIRKQYIIGFTPADTAGGGRYRHVSVTLDAASPRKATVYWRHGYYFPAN